MQESGKQSSLPPPPEEVGSKRKGRRQDDMPNSLRQMLELKVQPGPSFPRHAATHMLVCMEVLEVACMGSRIPDLLQAAAVNVSMRFAGKAREPAQEAVAAGSQPAACTRGATA